MNVNFRLTSLLGRKTISGYFSNVNEGYMALTIIAACESDSVGATETLSLFSSGAVLVDGFYGVDAEGNPKCVKVSDDKKSLTFDVIAGSNFLTVTLFSPSTKPETATLYQGDPVDGALADIDVFDHSGIGSVLIQGT